MGKTGIGVNGNLIPVKPGEVRNPKGKPKGTVHLSTHIQNILNDEEFTAEMIDAQGNKLHFKGHPVKAIIQTAIIKATQGDKHWADWLAQNGYGSKLVLSPEDPVGAILNKMGLGESDAGQAEDTSEATSEDVS